MKKNYLQIRLSDRRMARLREYCADRDITMTRVFEDLIDTLPARREGTPDAANNLADQEQH
ncbi:MAG: hypothetical protein KME49_23210 [Brasilonema octagenarum HA4186-MV1]|nr:hypothetical protein [Brasilonema octagenarum HA4186-MV1]